MLIIVIIIMIMIIMIIIMIKNNDNNNNNNLYIPDGFCLCKGYQAIRLSAWPAWRGVWAGSIAGLKELRECIYVYMYICIHVYMSLLWDIYLYYIHTDISTSYLQVVLFFWFLGLSPEGQCQLKQHELERENGRLKQAWNWAQIPRKRVDGCGKIRSLLYC